MASEPPTNTSSTPAPVVADTMETETESAQPSVAANNLAGTTPAPAEAAAGAGATAEVPAQATSTTTEVPQVADGTAATPAATAAPVTEASAVSASAAAEETKPVPTTTTTTSSPGGGTFDKLKKRFSILGSRTGGSPKANKEHRRNASSVLTHNSPLQLAEALSQKKKEEDSSTKVEKPVDAHGQAGSTRNVLTHTSPLQMAEALSHKKKEENGTKVEKPVDAHGQAVSTRNFLTHTSPLQMAEALSQKKKESAAAAVPPPPEKESKSSSVISGQPKQELAEEDKSKITLSGAPAAADVSAPATVPASTSIADVEERTASAAPAAVTDAAAAAPATPEKTPSVSMKRDVSQPTSTTASKILATSPIAVGAAPATTATDTDAATARNANGVAAQPPAVPAKDRPSSSLFLFNKKDANADVKMASAGAAAAVVAGRAPLISTDKSMPDYTPEARSLNGPKTDGLRKLYPVIEPYEKGHLKVDDLHEIYWEWSGKKDGHPAVFLHGGPGGGVSGGDRRWFDPSHYRVLCFDQRGAGQSTPPAELKGNTTWDLVSDIEKLRTKFGIEKWHVFGGSWGSTLSLAYAQKHPERVSALILRGIFTLRKSELQFFYQDGASHIFPEQFKPYREHIPERERGDMIKAYYKRLTHKDEKVRLEAARKWSTWENATSKLYVDLEAISHGDDDKWALAFARIESHYFINAGWMKDGQLLEKSNIDKIRHIPAAIVQGRYDVVCPATTAWKLHEMWPEAEFHLVPDCGHSAREPGIASKLLEATDKLKSVK